ncbi:MAG: glycosyltransferase [Maribacter arcticus]|uniref:glycosyltransferase family 2 protein n=1 Tax=Maribacter arcticus TaxID=561365 RepID=UPI0030018C81
MNSLKVSIITAVYNSSSFIEEMVESVIGQSHENWELILIDDFSADTSRQIIKKYMETDERIHLIENNENLGPAPTRNKGISFATGDFLSFLDSDDIWHSNFLKKSLNFAVENNFEFVFASYERCDEQLNPQLKDFIVPEKVNYTDVLKSCPIACLTALIDIRRIGKFYMPDLKKRQDWCLWLAILKEVPYAYGIKEPMAIYRMRKHSISRNKLKLIPYVWKVFRNVEKKNVFYSLYLLNIWALSGLKKYYVNTKLD